MTEKIEVIRCRQRIRKGQEQLIPERKVELGVGDDYTISRIDGRISVVITRAGFWKRLRIKVLGG